MGTVKLNISLDERVVELMRDRAAQLNKPASRYLAELVREDVRRYRDELAEEGYRVLAEEAADFAAAALPLAIETWPAWEEKATPPPTAVTTGAQGHQRDP